MGVSYWEISELLRVFGNLSTEEMKKYFGCRQCDLTKQLAVLRAKRIIRNAGTKKSKRGHLCIIWSLTKQSKLVLKRDDVESFYDTEYARLREARRIEIFGEAGRFRRW